MGKHKYSDARRRKRRPIRQKPITNREEFQKEFFPDDVGKLCPYCDRPLRKIKRRGR